MFNLFIFDWIAINITDNKIIVEPIIPVIFGISSKKMNANIVIIGNLIKSTGANNDTFTSEKAFVIKLIDKAPSRPWIISSIKIFILNPLKNWSN